MAISTSQNWVTSRAHLQGQPGALGLARSRRFASHDRPSLSHGGDYDRAVAEGLIAERPPGGAAAGDPCSSPARPAEDKDQSGD
jgi:hypothetical protein